MTENTSAGVRRTAQRVGAVGAVVALTGLAFAGSAFAATGTSQAAASALTSSLAGQPLATTGTSRATNDGTMARQTATFTGPIAALPGQGTARAGVVSQTAIATRMATSAACAGTVGPGGGLTVGNDGSCTLTGANTPFTVNLGSIPNPVAALPALPVTLTATAIYSQCTAGPSGGGPFTASSTLANVNLNLAGVAIPVSASSPTSLPAVLAPLLTLSLNQTSSTGPTSSATALRLTAVGATLASVTIGAVTCGENATVSDIPMVPVQGAGVAGVTALVVGGGWLALRRRRSVLA